jgi:hypothetical protein
MFAFSDIHTKKTQPPEVNIFMPKTMRGDGITTAPNDILRIPIFRNNPSEHDKRYPDPMQQ